MQFCLDHIALAVPDAARATPLLVGELGGERHEAGPGRGFRFWQWRYAGGGRLEILEPDGPPGGFLHRFLAGRGPGVHHVTFRVEDIGAAIHRAEAHGYRVVGFNEDFPGWKEAFLHPKQAQGIVVQLAEQAPDLVYPGTWPFPSAPDASLPPATIVGLRLAARGAERACHQWEQLLGARRSRRGERLDFRFPDSPLRICVEVDPLVPEGSLGIEVALPDGRNLAPGPHPVLGTEFHCVDGRAA